ncbi:NucA/NucB deoxyribonuclease domain-containing protein [Streptomyces sp. NPDC051104]|uniref:NucA/NucB deoxyribonuclease domain-containing protein n=1 Tax=Streptomyces sp. NPDC051104 TaxID=3155044 RepID=UPI00341FFC02
MTATLPTAFQHRGYKLQLKALLTTGAVALGLFGAATPTALADQPGTEDLRVTIKSAQPQVHGLTDSASDATCTINQIMVNRYSECEWVAVHVDVMKEVNGAPTVVGTIDYDVKHQMTLLANSANWSETFTVSKARVTREGKDVHVNIAATSGGGTKATVHFSQGHILDSGPANGSIDYTTAAIPKGTVNPKAKTHYTYTFTKPGIIPGSVSYDSAVYRCDNYYGSARASRSGCAIPEAPTAVSMVGIPYINDGIRKLRANGGHYGDPNGGQPLHWMINPTQEDKNRKAVCSVPVPPDMQSAGRTSCDEYPFASTYEGGTYLPANQREITWVNVQENRTQGGTITAWRNKMHVMDGDPFYVIV